MILYTALLLAVAPAQQAPPDWRAEATAADRGRMRGWRSDWIAALHRVRQAGGAAVLVRGGALFDPDIALDGPIPPAGRYRCRVVKLGSRMPGKPAIARLPAAPCRLSEDGEFARFSLVGSSQRIAGRVYRDNDQRAVFLGTLALGDERGVVRYGRDARRDMIGRIERIGPQRWRLVLPRPAFQSMLDIVEITPG